MMDATVFDRIKELSAIENRVTTIGEQTYTDKTLNRIPQSNQVKPEFMQFHTLTGLTEYFRQNIDKLDFNGMAFHVKSPSIVDLCGPLQAENDNQRFIYARAQYSGQGFQFNHWHDLDLFIIQLQSLFERSSTIAQVVAALSNMADKEVKEAIDNGFTLTLRVKTGIEILQDIEIENPLKLQPFMTFREVKQPNFNCILRYRGERGAGTQCALFEADGGLWMIQAVEAIKKWLRGALGNDFPILA
jgi:hypothetical protein